MGNIMYPLGKQVRVWVHTTYTRMPAGKINSSTICDKHVKLYIVSEGLNIDN
jgi:hypothetical protein